MVITFNTKHCSTEGKDFKITASFSKSATVGKLFVNVFGRTGLLSSEKMAPDLVDDKFVFLVHATKQMVPSCRVVCYYVHNSGEIVYDQLVLTVEPATNHSVSRQQISYTGVR